MTEDDLMADVWADPDCPVTLAVPDAEYPWGTPVPYPKTRVEVPAGHQVWQHRCGCRGGRSALGFADESGPIRPASVSIAELRSRVWVANEPGRERSVLVHIGQCGNCGRIYWGTNWGGT